MTTQARQLAISAYREGEMNFFIRPEDANLAAEHSNNPMGLIRAGKAHVDSLYDATDKEGASEEELDELEELVIYYGEYLMGEHGDLTGWEQYNRWQILVAAWLLVHQQSESEEQTLFVGSYASRLSGSLSGHIEIALGVLLAEDPQDLADELEAVHA